MNIRILLGLALLVALVSGGSYLMLSSGSDDASVEGDIAQTEERADAFPPVGENETVSDDSPYIVTDDRDAAGADGDVDAEVAVPAEDDAAPAASLTSAPKETIITTPVPAPTPTPTPVPTPAPTPAPKPSGYTMTDVAQHASQSSCWTAINGSVYDITSYIPRHPGGERNAMRLCGIDGTSVFERQHGGDSKPEKILATLRIGALVE